MFVHALFCACAPHPPAPGGVQLSQSELMTTHSLFLCILFTDLMCISFWNTVSVTAFLSVKKITYYWFSYSVFHLSWTASVSINRFIIRHSVICNQLLWCFLQTRKAPSERSAVVKLAWFHRGTEGKCDDDWQLSITLWCLTWQQMQVQIWNWCT